MPIPSRPALLMAIVVACQLPVMAEKAAPRLPAAQKGATKKLPAAGTNAPKTAVTAKQSARTAAVKPGAAATPAAKVAPPLEKTYVLKMQPLIQTYDQIMLALVAPGNDDGDAGVTVSEVAELTRAIAETSPPQELADQHKLLARSLATVGQFLTTGGRAAHGFHTALVVAERMEAISSSYHSAVLACLKAHDLPASLDPFLDPRAAAAFKAQRSANGRLIRAGRNSSRQRRSVAGNRASDQADAESERPGPFAESNAPAMVNGVDGSMSMSGLFNGLGGTSTNGLVDGLGVSSGMNGLVNGAGLSEGMSGRMNDTESGSYR